MSVLGLTDSGGETIFPNNPAWQGVLSNDDSMMMNVTALNATRVGVDAETDYTMDAIGYFLVTPTLLLVILCWICNAVVIKALNQLEEEKMKVKFLIKNAILGDILVSISICIRSIFAMTGLIENSQAGIVYRCIYISYVVYGFIVAFYQIFTCMAVACDRFYSILKPLKYYSMVYSKGAKFTIVAIIVFVVTALSVPVALVKLQPGKPIITICQDAHSRSFYSTSVVPYAIMSSVFATLFIYCGVLCLIAYHRRAHRNSLGEINENQNVRRRQASLAITFFLINISYVIMYIPFPVYMALRPSGLKPNLNFYFTQITLMIYLCNTVIDPLIYIFRIKSIRDSVRRIFNREQKKDLSNSSSSQKTNI